MPFDKSKYPANWKQIRAEILERAGHKCEQCGVPNHVWIVRDVNKEHWPEKGAPSKNALYDIFVQEFGLEGSHFLKPVRIVLTIAHIDDRDPMSCDPSNLKALCQLHHLQHDAKQHALNAAATRARKKQEKLESEGQLSWV